MRKLGFLVALPIVGALVGIAPAAAQTSPEVTSFCDAALTADKAVAKVESGTKPKQQDVQALETALSQAESTAPPEIAAQVQGVVATTRSSVQSGKDPNQDPTFEQNFNALQQYRYNSCGYPQVEVSAIEYEFQGLPKTLPPGPAAVRFTDDGTELHELAVFRLKTKDSVKKLLGQSEKQQRKKVEEVGGTFVTQGQTSYTIVDFSKAGRYGVVCFLPVGSTSEQQAEKKSHEHGGTPHWKKGMFGTITVANA